MKGAIPLTLCKFVSRYSAYLSKTVAAIGHRKRRLCPRSCPIPFRDFVRNKLQMETSHSLILFSLHVHAVVVHRRARVSPHAPLPSAYPLP